MGGILVSGTRLRNEFLPGQEQDGQSRDPSEGGVPSANESGARPNIQIFPAMESLPQTFGRLNSGGMFSAELQSSECPVGRRRKIRGQKGGKKDEEIMNFSGIQILQILHILIFLLVHFFETLVCRRLNKRCELTCPRPLSALQM